MHPATWLAGSARSRVPQANERVRLTLPSRMVQAPGEESRPRIKLWMATAGWCGWSPSWISNLNCVWIYNLRYSNICQYPFLLLKGLGHEIEFKYFNWEQIFLGIIRTSARFLTFQMSHWKAVAIFIFNADMVKIYWRTNNYCRILPNYFAALFALCWFMGWTLDSYWSIIPTPIWFYNW